MGLRATYLGSQILGICGTISFDIQNVPAAGPQKMTPKPARMVPIHPNMLITFETLTLFLLNSSAILWNTGSFWAGASHRWETSLWVSSAPSSSPDWVWKSTCPETNPNISSPNSSHKASCSLCSDCFRKKKCSKSQGSNTLASLGAEKVFQWVCLTSVFHPGRQTQEWRKETILMTSPGCKICSVDSHRG